MSKKANKKTTKYSKVVKKDTDDIFIMSTKYKNLLDYKKILNSTQNKKDLSVTLKSNKEKGVGLYATKPIQKGEIIAYYKIKLFKESTYQSTTNYMYSFEVYKKDGNIYKRLIGDIDLNSFPEPLNDITFWAPFANEPSIGQKSNANIDMNLKDNYKNRTKVIEGNVLIYKLVAKRYIEKGEEILWYYGDDYNRNYVASKL